MAFIGDVPTCVQCRRHVFPSKINKATQLYPGLLPCRQIWQIGLLLSLSNYGATRSVVVPGVKEKITLHTVKSDKVCVWIKPAWTTWSVEALGHLELLPFPVRSNGGHNEWVDIGFWVSIWGTEIDTLTCKTDRSKKRHSLKLKATDQAGTFDQLEVWTC